MIYIGIDPGSSGGMAILDNDGQVIITHSFAKMTEQDIHEALPTGLVRRACLEQVSAMPKQGVSSTFKFGRSFGILEGLLIGSETPYRLVRPQQWQRFMRCLSRGDKNVTKRAAQQRWPQHKITHAIADAMLIAEYCRLTEA
jgi:hypothetical protein